MPKTHAAIRKEKAAIKAFGETVAPVHLDYDHWFYANHDGVTIAYTARGTMQSIAGCVTIPWRKLAAGIEKRKKFLRLMQTKRPRKKRA